MVAAVPLDACPGKTVDVYSFKVLISGTIAMSGLHSPTIDTIEGVKKFPWEETRVRTFEGKFDSRLHSPLSYACSLFFEVA